jgi:predicted transcriptional regulator
MRSLLVQLDEATCRSLSHLAPPASRRRAQFIRGAIRKAVREAEYARIRKAYEARPDSEAEADDWSTAEEYKP